MSPGLDPRLVKVRSGGRGSGWGIGTCGVVTARHVVAPFIDGRSPSCLAVLDPALGAATFDCDVVWDDAVRDLALLKVHADQVAGWQLALQGSRSPALAEPGTSAIEVDAVGYPDATVERDLPQPDPVRGWLLPAGGAVSRRMPFDLITAVPAESTLWKGMSGSGVLLDGRLLGVVVEVDELWAARRMYVSTFPDPADDEVFARALADVGAPPVVEAFDAPAVRGMLAVVDPAGRPYPADAVPDVGSFGARTARTDIDNLGDAYFPYVHRPLDVQLADSLGRRLSGADRRMLLIVGAAMTGKSRTGAEAVRTHPLLRSLPVLIPRRHTNLREIESIAPPGRSILWLDDLDEYLARLDRDVLRTWQANPDLVVVATLRTDVLQNLMDKGELRSAWDLVTDDSLVEQFQLGDWSADDQRALEGVDPDIRRAVADGAPLGEVLGAAEELRKRFANAGERDRALVMVVADWTRTGVSDPLDEQLARTLWPAYLSPREARRIEELVDEDLARAFASSLAWARAAIADTGTALVSRTRHGLRAEDYIVGRRVGEDIAEPIWQAALQFAFDDDEPEPKTLLAVGYYSALAHVNEIARRALTAVVESGTSLAPLARVNLGGVLVDEDPAQAQELLEAALSAPERHLVWSAQAVLGGLLIVRDPDRGRELLEDALASGDPRVVPLAQVNLGPLLQARDPVRARALLTAALSSGDRRVVPLAQANLAGLVLEDEPVLARELLEAALASGDPRVRPLAQSNLAAVLLSEDPARARELLEAALASGNWQVMPIAQTNLAGLLLSEDPARARQLLEAGLASGNWQVMPVASANMGALLVVEDPARARELLEAALGATSRQARSLAQISLAVLIQATDPVRARTLLVAAAESGIRAAQAWYLLGDIDSEKGDPEAAAAAYERAIGVNDAQWSNVARVDLAALIEEQDPERARTLMETAMAAENSEALSYAQISLAQQVKDTDPVRARGLFNEVIAGGGRLAQAWDLLGDLEAEQGDTVAAAAAYEAAIARGESYWSDLARLDLARLLEVSDPGRAQEVLEAALRSASEHLLSNAQISLALLVGGEEPARARDLLQAAAASGFRAAEACDRLGDLERSLDDRSAAVAAYERAIEFEDSYWSNVARVDLAELLSDDDPDRARALLEEAIGSVSGTVLSLAQVTLAGLIDDDPVRARSLLNAAAEDEYVRANAFDYLGDVEKQAGDLPAALAAYERAVAVGDTYWSDIARIDLAALVSDTDPARAFELLTAAATNADHGVAEIAEARLAELAATP